MLYFFELANRWHQSLIISSSEARDMIVSVGNVEATKQLDLWGLLEFLGILYLELRLKIFMEYNRLSEGSVQKVSEFLEMFKRLKIFV